MSNAGKRCLRCLMVTTFPGITLNGQGLCNLCLNFKKVQPIGEDKLKEIIKSTKGDKYDCVVGISGGKDSCYVAYLAAKKYKLRALGIFYDSPFYCDLARKNVQSVCDTLGMDLKTITSKGNLEYKLLQNHMRSVGATGTTWGQCLFCHYGINAVIYGVANEMAIPFSLGGATRYERWNAGSRNQILLKRVKGLAYSDLLKFIFYQSKTYLLLLKQRKQFKMPCESPLNVYKRTPKPSNSLTSINVFDYIQWDPDVIEKTLTKEAGWIKPEGSISWGYDCSLEPFLIYTYKKEFGISTVGLYLSHLIRDGLIKRSDALKILETSEDEESMKNKMDSVFDFLKIPKQISDKFYAAQ